MANAATAADDAPPAHATHSYAELLMRFQIPPMSENNARSDFGSTVKLACAFEFSVFSLFARAKVQPSQRED
jgi:hypothetical protein